MCYGEQLHATRISVFCMGEMIKFDTLKQNYACLILCVCVRACVLVYIVCSVCVYMCAHAGFSNGWNENTFLFRCELYFAIAGDLAPVSCS